MEEIKLGSIATTSQRSPNKEKLFKAFHTLLKFRRRTLAGFIIETLICFLQLLRFTYDIKVFFIFLKLLSFEDLLIKDYWEGEKTRIENINSFLQMFQILPWISDLSWNMHLALFYFVIAVIFGSLLGVSILALSSQTNISSSTWLITLLNNILILFKGVLYLPILEVLFSIIECDSNLNQRHHEEVECFTLEHSIHSIFCFIFILLFIFVVCFMLGIFYHETQRIETDVTSKLSNIDSFWESIFKTIIFIIFLFTLNDDMLLAISTLQFIFWVLFAIKCNNDYQYYFLWPRKLLSILNIIKIWVNLWFLEIVLLGDEIIVEQISITFVGIPFIIYLVLFFDQKTTSFAKINSLKFTEKEFLKHILEIRTSIKEFDESRMERISTYGRMAVHNEQCLNTKISVLLKTLTTLLRAYKNKPPSKKEMKCMIEIPKNKSIFNYHIVDYYKNFISVYPESVWGRFVKCEYLNEIKEYELAYREIVHTEKISGGLFEQFALYHLKQNIFEKRETIDKESEISNKQQIMHDFMSLSMHIQSFKSSLLRGVKLNTMFWSIVQETKPNLTKLQRTGQKIIKEKTNIDKEFRDLIQLHPNPLRVTRMYIMYLKLVDNNSKHAQLWENRMEEMRLKGNELDLGKECTAQLTLSGNEANYGLIINCNMGFSSLFGQEQKNLLGNTIHRIFPPLYENIILELISESGNLAGNKNLLAKGEHLILGIKNNGYVFPVLCRMKEAPNVVNNFTLTLNFTTDQREWNAKKSYLLLDESLKIEGISSNCLTLLSLTKSFILNNSTYAKTLFHDLSLMEHRNPTGAPLTYTPPLNNTSTSTCISDKYEYSDKHNLEPDILITPNIKGEDNPGRLGSIIRERGNLDDEEEIVTKVLPYTGDLHAWILQVSHSGDATQKPLGYILCLEKEKPKTEVNINSYIKYPLFQFRYDNYYNRFVREIDDPETKELNIRAFQFQSIESSTRKSRTKIVKKSNESIYSTPEKPILKNVEEIQVEFPKFYMELMPRIKFINNYKIHNEEFSYESDDLKIDIEQIKRKANFSEGITTQTWVNGEFKCVEGINICQLGILAQNEMETVVNRKETKTESQNKQNYFAMHNIHNRTDLEEALKEAKIPMQFTFMRFFYILYTLIIFALGIYYYVKDLATYEELDVSLHYADNRLENELYFTITIYNIREIHLLKHDLLNNFQLLNYLNIEEYYSEIVDQTKEYCTNMALLEEKREYYANKLKNQDLIELTNEKNTQILIPNTNGLIDSKSVSYIEGLKRILADCTIVSNSPRNSNQMDVNMAITLAIRNGYGNFHLMLQTSTHNASQQFSDQTQPYDMKASIQIGIIVMILLLFLVCQMGIVQILNRKLNTIYEYFQEIGDGKIDELQEKCLKIQRALNYNIGLDDDFSEENNYQIVTNDSKFSNISEMHRSKKIFVNRPGIWTNFGSLILYFLGLTMLGIAYFSQNELRIYTFKESLEDFYEVFTIGSKQLTLMILQLGLFREIAYNHDLDYQLMGLKPMTAVIYYINEMHDGMKTFELYEERVEMFNSEAKSRIREIMNSNLCVSYNSFRTQEECEEYHNGILKIGVDTVLEDMLSEMRNILWDYRSRESSNEWIDSTRVISMSFIQKYMLERIFREIKKEFHEAIEQRVSQEELQNLALFITFVIILLFIILLLEITLNLISKRYKNSHLILANIPLDHLAKMKATIQYIAKITKSS